jgi:aspartate ammonia-lyase
MEVVRQLQALSGLPLSRSENLADTTSNLDAFVEVHATIKAHAVNIEKMVSDIRLLASDLAGSGELEIPARQTGSTIMPGKVNPVIPEFVISAAHKVYANDQLIAGLAAQGCLELNAYLPVIGDAMLNSLKLLIAADTTLLHNLLKGIHFSPIVGAERLFNSPAITTALSPFIGYKQAALVAKEMKTRQCDVFEAVASLGYMEKGRLADILKPENLLKNGFTLNELIDES